MRVLSRVARAAAEAQASAPVITCCSECGREFDQERKGTAVCSTKCGKRRDRKRPARRAQKRAWRVARKALQRAASVESFDPYEIFNRDGWKCQICGVKTPEKLRGSFKPNAPELDHVIPLSKGGPHSRANSQCCCRNCNATKGAGRPQGQIGLFT